MSIRGFDHVALPARDPEALLAFYKKLGFGTIHEDEWTAATADGSMAAHFEHTILITEHGCETLTSISGVH